MINKELKIFREQEKLNPVHESDIFLESQSTKFFDMDPSLLKLELSLLQNKYDILSEKDKALQKLCATQVSKNKNSKDLNIFLNETMKILNGKPKK